MSTWCIKYIKQVYELFFSVNEKRLNKKIQHEFIKEKNLTLEDSITAEWIKFERRKIYLKVFLSQYHTVWNHDTFV